jgi:uncharacterized protein (DUF983 family)
MTGEPLATVTLDWLRAQAVAEAQALARQAKLPRDWRIACPRCGVAKLPKHFADDSHVCHQCAAEIDEHGDAWLWRPPA